MIYLLNSILLAILRSVAAFVLILIVTRVLGRKAISQMTFFDFAVAISMGSITASIAIAGDNSFHTPITVLITFGVLGLLNDIFYIKSLRFSKLVNSEPLIMIQDGLINDKNMRKARVSINELNSQLREKNIFDISEVQFAILENSGKLSVLPKAQNKPLTPKDMQLNPAEGGLSKDIIIDGAIMTENLNACNLTEDWLRNELKRQGISEAKVVFYAGLSPNGSLYISKKSTQDIERPGQHGIE